MCGEVVFHTAGLQTLQGICCRYSTAQYSTVQYSAVRLLAASLVCKPGSGRLEAMLTLSLLQVC